MRPQVQLLIGFMLFVIGNASVQGLIPDTTIGKWIILVTTSATLFMQKVGLSTDPDRKALSKETRADMVAATLEPRTTITTITPGAGEDHL